MPDIRATCRQYTDGLSSRMVHHRMIAHCEQHDKLPQKGECFIHRASDVASKQPLFKPR